MLSNLEGSSIVTLFFQSVKTPCPKCFKEKTNEVIEKEETGKQRAYSSIAALPNSVAVAFSIAWNILQA